MTYREARLQATAKLRDLGIEDAASDVDLLLEAICHLKRMDLFLRGEDPMPAEQEEAFHAALDKRCRRIPVQHITGEQYFCGYRFAVNENVLIPRQETEQLVMLAAEKLETAAHTEGHENAGRILDLCTGSGCIGISLKLQFPDAGVVLSDLSEKALTVAAENAKQLGAAVEINRGDLFEGIEGLFDVIVSNPPYIASQIIETLQEEVRLHDPRMALDGSDDGLFFYRRIAAEGSTFLKEDGWLLLEIGHDQGETVPELLSENGWKNIQVHRDLAGLDRVITAQKG